MVFERRRRHFDRYVEIGGILARHGWESILSRFGLAQVFQVRGWGRGAIPEPVQVRETLEELGPTFVKLGQVLSTRPDVLPPEYILELEELQDNAPHVAYGEIKEVIEHEFGRRIASVYAEFSEKPLAAASLGQTHLARLTDGTEVVVKVQRPGIRSLIETDLEIVADVASFLERHSERLRVYGLCDIVEEFAITIRQEIDYTREGRNGDVLRENLASLNYVHVAKTMWEYSTSRVLTAERIVGVKITDMAAIVSQGGDRHVIAGNLWQTYLQMIFIDAFFHADPHPGNLVVEENNVIGLMDYGMVGRLDREIKTHVTMLLSRYVEEDSNGVAEVLLAMGTVPPNLNRRQFTSDTDRLLRQYYGAPLSEVHMGEALSGLLRLSSKYRLRLPSNLSLLVKVMIGVEGIDSLLDPNYDMAADAKPFINKAVQREFSVSGLKGDLFQSLLYWKSLISELPRRTGQVLDNMADGNFRIVFKHEGLEDTTRNLDQSANRLSLALISASTTIASALVLSSKVGPLWRGYPVIGLLGFAITFIFGLWLMISIIRAGRLW